MVKSMQEQNHSTPSEGGKRKKGGAHSYVPAHRTLYVCGSLFGNTLFGIMGLGLGFLFFVTKVVATGTILLNVMVFGIGAVIIVIYLYILLLLNRWWVKKCSDHKSKRNDSNRLFFSMLYVVCVVIVSIAYSFLRAAIMANVAD